MNIGDLVQKVAGYGAEEEWTGIVVARDEVVGRVKVLTVDGIEAWQIAFLKVINGDQ